MSRREAQLCLQRLGSLAAPGAVLSILGGEPTLHPLRLLESVEDATAAGFTVSLVTNGWGLTRELVEQLADRGLGQIAMSVDADPYSSKREINKAIDRLGYASELGIISSINTVLTSRTSLEDLRVFSETVIRESIYLHPLVCSPSKNGGSFSSAPPALVPSQEQLRKFFYYIAKLKLTTGRITSAWVYLFQWLRLGSGSDGVARLWHCSPTLKTHESGGRGYLLLDSDGFVGPCQEYPRTYDLLSSDDASLSMEYLDSVLSAPTLSCDGCSYSCYVQEEKMSGLGSLAEAPLAISLLRSQRKRGNRL
jgi:MoaA/NifB/PqqE/SkfB family radical SAM enzyme